MTIRLNVSLVLLILAAAASPASADCQARSGANTTALLELYTSEGCDSCPPADRWLGELRKKGYSRDRLVPLAFHVDYWNYIGWVDPFAQARFTDRQREFARRTSASTVYTPEFVLQGREYRRWFKTDFADQLARHNTAPARADLALKLARTANVLQIEVNVRAKAPAELFLAVYENNLRTQVKAGENRGRTLEHAFVVRELIGPIAIGHSGRLELQKGVPLSDAWKRPDMGVAAFVQAANGTDILQALALDFCPALQK